MDKTALLLPKKLPRFRLRYVLGALLFLLTVVGGAVAFYLSQQDQDIRQQAAGGGCLYECKKSGGSDQDCARKCDPSKQSGDLCPGSCQPGSCSSTDQTPTGTGRCGAGNSQYCCKPKPTVVPTTSPTSTPISNPSPTPSSTPASSGEVVAGPNNGQCYCKNSSGQNYVCRDQTLCCANTKTAALVTACKKPESTSGPEVVAGPNAQQCYCKNSQGLNYVCRDQTVCCSNPSYVPYVAACKNAASSASRTAASPSPSVVPLTTRIKNTANETLVGPSGSYCYCKDPQGFNYLCTNQALCCGNKYFATYMAVCQTNYVAPTAAISTPSPSPSPKATPDSQQLASATKTVDPTKQCLYSVARCSDYGRKTASGCLSCSGVCCGDKLETPSNVCGPNDNKTVTVDGKKMSCLKGSLYPYFSSDTNKGSQSTSTELTTNLATGVVTGSYNPNIAGFTQSGPSATEELRRIGCGPTNVTNALLRMGVKALPNGKPLTPNNMVEYYFGPNAKGKYGAFNGSGGIDVKVAEKILKENGAKTNSLTASANTNDTHIDLQNTKPNPSGTVREKQLAKIKTAIESGHQVLVTGEFWAGGVKHVHYTTLTKIDSNGNFYGYDTSIPSQNGGYYQSDTANLINYTQLPSSVIRQAVEIYQ